MSMKFRQFVIAAMTGLTFAGFAAHVYADDAAQDLQKDCIAQADDSGLQGEDRAQFVQQCVEEGSQSQGSN